MNTNELIIEYLLDARARTPDDLSSAKRKFAKSHKITCPNNISLLKAYHGLLFKKSIKKNVLLEKILKTRPVRSLSGIVNVSVLTKPYKCPGACIYCPSEPNIPKSYLSGEPAVERAKSLNYDPYIQVKKRIEVLNMSGHITDKIDLRLIGGTWSYYELKYKIWFVVKCFEACNNQRNTNEDYKKLSVPKLYNRLEKAQFKNEHAKHRIIGLSFETRPDYINLKEIEQMKKLGATKVELGVQSIYNDILKFNKRGHTIRETVKATKLLKDAGFKVAYQMMLNLPKSNPERDIRMFKELFTNSNFQPDFLKIYPCALVKQAPLYELYKKGWYVPYNRETLVKTIEAIKKILPRYVRVERIIRDIPSPSIVSGGARISNLRQLIEEDMLKEKWHCQCIRCREVKDKIIKTSLNLFREDYKASNGHEIFLSFEDSKRNNLYSLLRLRIPSKNRDILPVLNNCALIREVHVYGQTAQISKRNSKTQHKGLGVKMIKEAEKIAKKEFKLNKIAIISGVGVRDYYRSKLGYRLEDGYMIRDI